jgi:4-diphosphocytidyl-2-C-methyl-D-erythritol kinase
MATSVRSFSKINLGLAIGPLRKDGFHGLTTMYQTLALHDVVTVSAVRASETRLTVTSNHPWVPADARNTAWRMVDRCLAQLAITAEVRIRIQKNLPVQGGMGAGSANAAAALLGLERELGVALSGSARLELAAEIGSDVPLFLLGGAVLGLGRGEQVVPLPDIPATWCVVAMPEVGVSTPQAFRDWDALARQYRQDSAAGDLTPAEGQGTLMELSCALASTYAEPGTSGIFCNPGENQGRPEKKRGGFDESPGITQNDLAESSLLSLARTGIENDFERVVFPIHPSLREIKRQLMGIDSAASTWPGDDLRASGTDKPGSALSSSALYAALSGSGSALFGLYRSEADAKAAHQRVQAAGCKAVTTHTLPRAEYWRRMFADQSAN